MSELPPLRSISSLPIRDFSPIPTQRENNLSDLESNYPPKQYAVNVISEGKQEAPVGNSTIISPRAAGRQGAVGIGGGNLFPAEIFSFSSLANRSKKSSYVVPINYEEESNDNDNYGKDTINTFSTKNTDSLTSEMVKDLFAHPCSLSLLECNELDEQIEMKKILYKKLVLETSRFNDKKLAHFLKQVSETDLIKEEHEESHPGVKSKKRSSLCCYIIFLLLLFTLAVFGVLICMLSIFVFDRDYQYLPETALTYEELVSLNDSRPLYKVLLIGDSLNNRPYTFWNLGGRLQNALPEYRIPVYNHGRDSSEISEVANFIESDVQCQADVAFLFWDTDISNVDYDGYSYEEIVDIHKEYIANITYVVNVTLSSGVKHMAMAGPGLLGERDYFEVGYLTKRSVFDDKAEMLDLYQRMNREIARNLSIEYIDFRTKFLDSIPFWWMLGRYYVTVDGEHPNKFGTSIMVEAYSNLIREWYGSNETTLYT